jgi:hypothetical protein
MLFWRASRTRRPSRIFQLIVSQMSKGVSLLDRLAELDLALSSGERFIAEERFRFDEIAADSYRAAQEQSHLARLEAEQRSRIELRDRLEMEIAKFSAL